MPETTRSQERPVVHKWDPNSDADKPLFTLGEKGVEFDYPYVDILQFEQDAPKHVAINPNGPVSALVHGGRVLAESTPMCEYIDAAFPGPSMTLPFRSISRSVRADSRDTVVSRRTAKSRCWSSTARR